MNLEDACRAADAAVYAKTGHHLTDVQMLILRGALAGQTYEDIAANSHYSVSYIKKFAGPALWTVLSEGLGEPVSKTNFQTALARAMLVPPGLGAVPPSVVPTQPRLQSANLSGVPNPTTFFGRTQELDTLHHWIVADRCRVVLLSGMGGIGKTTVMARFVRQVYAEFESVMVQSCDSVSSLPDVFTLGRGADAATAIAPPSSIDQQIRQCVEQFRRHRCLLILDNVEELLQEGALAGQYRPDRQPWGDLLRQLAEAEHQSCVAVLGRELPAELVSIAGDRLPVRHWKVRGLMSEDAKQLLQAKGVNPNQPGIDELIQMKRGNPLALQIVATTIQELFGGNVAQLLKQSTVIIGDTLLELLNEQFGRLSELEKGVMYWLALERQSLTKMKENTRFMIASPSELLKTLQSLKRRSLLEEEVSAKTNEPLFTLQPIVLRHTLTQLLAQTAQDLLMALTTQSTQDLGVLRSHLLFSDDQFYAMRQSPMHLIEQSLMNQLQVEFGDRKNIHQTLNRLLVVLHEKTNQAVGYATTNIVNLQRILESQRL